MKQQKHIFNTKTQKIFEMIREAYFYTSNHSL